MNFKNIFNDAKGILKMFTGQVSSLVKEKKSSLKKKPKQEERFDVGIDDIKAAHEKIPKRLGYFAVGSGILIMLILTTMTWTKQVSSVDEKRAVVDDNKLKHGEVEISIDEQGWKHFQSRRIDIVTETTQKGIANVKKEMKANSVALTDTVRSDLNETKNIIKGYVEQIDLSMNSLKSEFSEKLSDVISEVDTKLKDNKEYVEQKTISLSNIDFSKTDSMLDGSSKLLPPPLASIAKKDSKVEKQIEIEKEEILIKPDSQDYTYADVVIDSIEVQSSDIATSLYSKTIDNAEGSMIYHIMKGLTNATLLTGINAPTFGGNNNKTPAPVLFSVDGDIFIANDETENIENCLISGSATGNVNTSKADILLTEISCSGYDTQGNKIKIEEQIKGWVIGEDGSFGLQGRLLDSSGKVITKMIALEIMQSLTDALVASATPSGVSSYGIGTQANIPYDSAAQRGLGEGVSRGLDHTFEHYSKILSGMYPTISVMAGKKVTLHLKGGEDIAPTPYNELDINEKLVSRKEVAK